MKRTLGVTILGCLFVFVGGFSLLVVLIQVIDSIGRYSFASLEVRSLLALKSVVTFVGIPILLYTTGIGMLLLRPWSRKSAMIAVPACVVSFVITNENFILWAVIIGLLVFFFNQPHVKKQFN